MARVENAKAGRADGGYTRVLGNADLGALVSKIHATSISAGTELEKIISEQHGHLMTEAQLGEFLSNQLAPNTYLIDKKILKKHIKPLIKSTAEPDFLIVVIKDSKIYVVELKDGDTFDTKKVAGEVASARDFSALLRTYLLQHQLSFNNQAYVVEVKFCSFNQSDKQKIITGFKGKITAKEAMTGQELCHLIGISYDNIIQQRKIDQEKNFDYFIKNLLEIHEVKASIQNHLNLGA